MPRKLPTCQRQGPVSQRLVNAAPAGRVVAVKDTRAIPPAKQDRTVRNRNEIASAKGGAQLLDGAGLDDDGPV